MIDSSVPLAPAPRSDVSEPGAGLVVRVEGVCVRFAGHDALRGVDLALHRSSLTAVTGPNGAGKSTLMEVLAGVRRPTAGRVEVLAGSVAFVPQRSAVSDRLPVTVRDVVVMGAWGEAGAWRRVSPEARARVGEAIAVLGLEALSRRPFSTLSGGERQRALLAQGLARGADLLLIDEPTTGLDTLSAAHICEALDREVTRGASVVCVSHDPVVIERAHRTVALEEGSILPEGAA